MMNRPIGMLYCNDLPHKYTLKTSYDVYLLIYYDMEKFPKWLCVDPRSNCVHIR